MFDRGRLALAGLVALASACGDAAQGRAPAPAPSADERSAAAAAAAHAPSSSASAARADRVELQRFKLTTAVENKEPKDELSVAGAGQRVYAHAVIRNRTGAARRVSLVFRVDGEERTTVDLTIEPAWSWRTWAYVTLRPGDEMATLKVELRDDKAELLAERSVPVRAKPSTKLR